MDQFFEQNQIQTELLATFSTPHLGIDSPVKQLLPFFNERLTKNLEKTIANRAQIDVGSDLLSPLSDLMVVSRTSFLVNHDTGLFDDHSVKALKKFKLKRFLRK